MFSQSSLFSGTVGVLNARGVLYTVVGSGSIVSITSNTRSNGGGPARWALELSCLLVPAGAAAAQSFP